MAKKKPYDILKQHCTDACRERHACKEGYRQMLASENVSQMMATWRANWDDVTHSKFADIICKHLPKVYASIKEEMNEAGVYWNECPVGARLYVKVLVTASKEPVHVYGDAGVYILEDAEVVAHDHAHVYNTHAEHAKVTLLNFSYGDTLTTDEVVRERFATHVTHPKRIDDNEQ